jgi:hypothetical protein
VTLDDKGVLYELHLCSSAPQYNKSVETFSDASRAFARQRHLEDRLLDDGWTLDRYESAVERPLGAP